MLFRKFFLTTVTALILTAGPSAWACYPPIKATLLDVSFIDGGVNYGGDNEHPMLKNSGTDGGWGDGNAISDPVWQDTNGDGTPEKNEPACYTRSTGATEATRSRIRVTVGIKVEPSGVPFTLKGKKGRRPVL